MGACFSTEDEEDDDIVIGSPDPKNFRHVAHLGSQSTPADIAGAWTKLNLNLVTKGLFV